MWSNSEGRARVFSLAWRLGVALGYWVSLEPGTSLIFSLCLALLLFSMPLAVPRDSKNDTRPSAPAGNLLWLLRIHSLPWSPQMKCYKFPLNDPDPVD